jgi:hypothetical protein
VVARGRWVEGALFGALCSALLGLLIAPGFRGVRPKAMVAAVVAVVVVDFWNVGNRVNIIFGGERSRGLLVLYWTGKGLLPVLLLGLAPQPGLAEQIR